MTIYSATFVKDTADKIACAFCGLAVSPDTVTSMGISGSNSQACMDPFQLLQPKNAARVLEMCPIICPLDPSWLITSR